MNRQLLHGLNWPEALESLPMKTENAKTRSSRGNQRKNILVAVDFSSASKNAFKRSLALVNDASRIILLHVIPPSAGKNGLGSLIDAARAGLSAFSRNGGTLHDCSVRTLVSVGTPFQEILAAAKKENVELIVLGVSEAAPLAGIALGHTVERVSRYASCAVLLVPESETGSPEH